jgi:signal transduction histidine kinase
VVTVAYNSMGLPAKLTSSVSGELVDGSVNVRAVSDAVSYDLAGRLSKLRLPAGGNLWRTWKYAPWHEQSSNGGQLISLRVGTSSDNGDESNWGSPDSWNKGFQNFACRLLWSLVRFGFQQGALLNGGWDQWQEDARPTDAALPKPSLSTFVPVADDSVVADLAWVQAYIADPDVIFVDTRSPKEYRDGHLPGARSWDWFTAALAAGWAAMQPAAHLLPRLMAAGITPDKEIVTDCATGVRGAHTWFVLTQLLGYPNVRTLAVFAYHSAFAMLQVGPSAPMQQQMQVEQAAQWREILMMVLQSMFIGSAIGLVAGIFTSRRLSQPIMQLAQAAESVRRRDFQQRIIGVTWAKELATLTTAFNAMAADLDESEQLRRQLLTDVAHELRTPLTVLAGNLNAALDRVYALTEEEFANLYSQTNHLIRLVNDLHELAQAEAGRLPLKLELTDLGELVRKSVALFTVLGEEQEVRLTAHVPATGPVLVVDGARIRQVLHNLLHNALQHTPGGGFILVSLTCDNDAVHLAVQDSGAGIEPTHLAHLFTRFYRTDQARSRDIGGSGLGLAIAKALVETQGGQIAAHSDGPGLGATFTIRLPLQPPH